MLADPVFERYHEFEFCNWRGWTPDQYADAPAVTCDWWWQFGILRGEIERPSKKDPADG